MKLHLITRDAGAIFIFVVWTLMAAFMGSAITWWIALYSAPTNYEKHKMQLERDGEETEAMKKWNKKQMRKSRGGG